MLRVACDDERPAPEHGGAFACEGDDDEDSVEDHPALELPQHTMFENQSTQNRARQKRREQGYSKNLLVIGNFIAYNQTTLLRPG